MGKVRLRPSVRASLVAASAVTALVLLSSNTSAQILFRTPTPKPTATPSPTPALTAPPTERPVPQPIPTTKPLPGTTSPKPSGSPGADESPGAGTTGSPQVGDGGSKIDDKLPDSLAKDLVVPNIPRTRPRNTSHLVALLQPLTELGYPLEQILVEGMGRFPVAGLAYYHDDWLAPRYHPIPHLHHGLDIFADFGTPIRSPDDGAVSRLTDDESSGGIAVWVRGDDGNAYFFAHMMERVAGIYVGMPVKVGTVIGYVGDTGNAKGGAPHLHFEIHPGGGAAVPPKPSVDSWLDEAEQIAPNWVAAKRAEFGSEKTTAKRTAATGKKNDEIETSMLLTLLDPVGGSVGMLPSLNVEPRRTGTISARLLDDLIQDRIQGRIFVPSSGIHLYD